MAISILTNYSALRAQNSVGRASSELDKSIMQLSTGLRINSASDDPSGFAMAEKLRGEINNLKSTSQGLQSGQTMLNIADSYMTSIISRLGDMSALASQATGSGDRNIIQQEMDNLKTEINTLSNSAEFNGKKLLNGNASAIWSSTNSTVKTIMNGNKVTEGNYNVTLTAGTGGSNSTYTSLVFQTADNTPITGITKLSALTSFQGTGGENILRNEQSLTITGSNGKTKTITLASGDDINKLNELLQTAMETIFTAVTSNKLNMVISGAITKLNTGAYGDQSRLSFSGNSQLLSAIGFSETKVGTNRPYTTSVQKNTAITTGTTRNGLVTLSDGASVQFDMNKIIQNDIDIDLGGNIAGGTNLINNSVTVNVKNNALKVYSPSGSSVDLSIGQMDSTSLGLDNISVLNDPMAAKNLIDNAMSKATTLASNMASKMRTVSTMQDSVNVTSENLVAARSRIVDLDMAQATSEFASRQVVLQSATAMLAQANMVPRYALQLLSRM